jgi:hypothetical protein
MVLLALPDGGVRQAIRLGIVLAADVRDGELERTRQLLAHPVEGIEARAPAGVLALHLPDHDFGIGEDVQRRRLPINGVLQRFQQRGILSHIVIMLPDPAGDPDLVPIRVLDDNTNPGRTRVAMGAAVDVSDKMRHRNVSWLETPCGETSLRSIHFFVHELRVFSELSRVPVEAAVQNKSPSFSCSLSTCSSTHFLPAYPGTSDDTLHRKWALTSVYRALSVAPVDG